MKLFQAIRTNLINLVSLTIVTVLVSLLVFTRKEGFAATSPGTMVQLQTSHVPTEEDEYYWRYIYPKVVRKEIYNLTESDLY